MDGPYTHAIDISDAWERLQFISEAWFEAQAEAGNPDPDPYDAAFLRFGVEHGPGAEHRMFE